MSTESPSEPAEPGSAVGVVARARLSVVRPTTEAEPKHPLPPPAARLLAQHRYLPHPQADYILNEVEFLLEASEQTGIASGMRLVGATNCGKTNLCAELVRRHPPVRLPTGWTFPVLYVHMPERAKLTQVYEAILEAMGDPMASLGDQKTRAARVRQMLQATRVRLLIFDEPHHLTEARSDGARLGLVEFGKAVQQLSVNVLFAGVRSIDDLTQAGGELARRYATRFKLEPYSLTRTDDITSLRTFCQMLGSDLPGLEASPLGHDDAFFAPLAAASGGALGAIAALVRLAAVLARKAEGRQLKLKHLAQVWDRHFCESDEPHLQHLKRKNGTLTNLFKDENKALQVFGQLVAGLQEE